MANDANKEADKAGSDGVSSWLGLDQIDWGGEAGKFYECWKINPCCGSPDAMKMLCCLGLWCCCGPCSTGKFFASSVDQECFFVPHCLMGCCLPCIAQWFTRTNLRNRLGIQGNMIGDCVCVCCCGCCSHCQTLRAVGTQEWNWFEPEFKMPQGVVPEMIFIK